MTDPVDPRLTDGSAPATPRSLFERLSELGIRTRTVTHRPVFTVEEARAHRGSIPGHHTKNLFLRNKKGRMWLVVCREDRDLDLRALGEALGAGRLSFGSARRLMDHLGVVPGAVNPFAVMNDREGAVTLVLDDGLLGGGPLNFHPLDNDRTTAISVEDFLRFLEAEGHPPVTLDFDRLSKEGA